MRLVGGVRRGAGLCRLDPTANRVHAPPMVNLAEIEALALKLPESDRAKLAAGMLDSLPDVLVEEDGGLAEALRRSEEMDRDPSACLTHEEFLKAVGRHHRYGVKRQ
jgi:hypothetical protein